MTRMTRMTPELDRLAAARPETARLDADLTNEDERQRLLTEIMTDRRPRRSRHRHRHIAFAAVAVTVTAGAAALGVTALTPAGQHARKQPAAKLAAWTVTKLADGNISLTFRQLWNPAALQSTLRADGVPASVSAQLNPACRAYPGGTPHRIGLPGTPLLDKVFPGSYQPLNIPGPTPTPTPFTPSSISLVIDPSALPGNAGVQLSFVRIVGRDPDGRPVATPFVGEDQMPAVVYASPQCTGS